MCHTHYWYAIGLKVPNLFSRSANMLVQHDCISYAALSNHPMYISSAPPQTFACWMWDTEAIQVFMQCFTGIQLRWPSYGSNVWVELYFTVIAIPVSHAHCCLCLEFNSSSPITSAQCFRDSWMYYMQLHWWLLDWLHSWHLYTVPMQPCTKDKVAPNPHQKCWFVRSERKYYHATKEGSFLNKMNKFLGLYDVSRTQQASMKLRLSKYALKSPKQ